MSIKLALALAATTVAASATIASANSNYFSIIGGGDNLHAVEIDVVRAAGDGEVRIETRDGMVLATTSVNAGANGDVRIPLKAAPQQDVFAKLYLDGVDGPVAQRVVNVN